MKLVLPAFLLALAAAAPAAAQVYGADDDPYSQNPFASNMTLPDPTPAPTPATPAATPQPSQDAAKPAQTTPATSPAPAPKPAQP